MHFARKLFELGQLKLLFSSHMFSGFKATWNTQKTLKNCYAPETFGGVGLARKISKTNASHFVSVKLSCTPQSAFLIKNDH